MSISAEDVAKRLIDYGFHAPTLSFPVPGTLMVEPTESESLVELDRFCDAMIAIRAEIAKVEAGTWTQGDNPLKAAPHTAATLLATEWTHAYTREEAAYPTASLRHGKYWSPVGRSTTSGAIATCRARARRWRATKTESERSLGTAYACGSGIVHSPPAAMPDLAESTTEFSHLTPPGHLLAQRRLRDFFLYKDLGIEKATHGRVIAQLVKANQAPEKGTGWHRHEADFHIVLMLKGWARFMYGDQETLVAAGDCVHQRPGVVHFLYDYSPDMEYLEVVGPADFTTVEMPAPAAVPDPAPWPAEAKAA